MEKDSFRWFEQIVRTYTLKPVKSVGNAHEEKEYIHTGWIRL